MKKYLLIFALILPMGCKTVSAPPPPLVTGAVNSFDQTSYQTLLAVQAAYNSLLTSYKANPTGLANMKAPLDQIATDYNIAESAWQVYHKSATAANQATLNASLTKVQADVAAVTP
jgi:hypothetical protein